MSIAELPSQYTPPTPVSGAERPRGLKEHLKLIYSGTKIALPTSLLSRTLRLRQSIGSASAVVKDELQPNPSVNPDLKTPEAVVYSTNGFTQLMIDASRFEILPPEKQTELAWIMDAGKIAAAELQKNPNLPEMEIARLKAAQEQGQEAKRTLMETNLRMVIKLAARHDQPGVDVLDLVQEGNLGISHGLDKFNPRKGVRVTTYTYSWARTKISEAVHELPRTIHTPDGTQEKQRGFLKKVDALIQRLGRNPTPQEAADHAKMPLDRAARLLGMLKETVSINQPMSEGNAFTLEDVLPSTCPDYNPSLQAEREDTSLILSQAIDQLTKQEQQVLNLRFGLEDGYERTLGDAGQELGLSRERIRQIQAEAIAKLRHPRIGLRQKLVGYL